MGINRIVITVMSGVEDGKVFDLDGTPIMLGRHPEDNVFLPYDTRTSRHHARITRESSSYFIEDVGPEGKGSTNSTYLHDNKITGKTAINSGDVLLLGNVWVKFEVKPMHLT
jgi:pSer/pThr/pTyr-binding forkhead associated (FHA) protein